MELTISASGLEQTKQAKADVSGPGIQGSLLLTEYKLHDAYYVHIKLEVSGEPNVLKAGVHAVHFHEKAACDCDGFKCAGGHFDPGPSGNTDPDANHGYHAGDLPSITIDETGHGLLEAITTRVTLSEGPVSLLGGVSAPEGTSIMIHANSDPHEPGESGSGKSGGPRLACGTIQAI